MHNHLAFKLLSLVFLAASMARAQSARPRMNIPAIAKSANGAVVSIVMSDKSGSPIAQGSGFFVSNDGLVVTNYHVIREGSSAVIKLPDGTSYAVDGVLAYDKRRDVAIIKAHGEDFRPLALGDSAHVEVGQEVVAIGNPLSLESTVSDGIISGVRKSDDLGGQLLQITAPISPGSSGGPLFTMDGKVIGITSGYLKTGENLNFAIPINDVKGLLVESGALAADISGRYFCDSDGPLRMRYRVSVAGSRLTLTLVSINNAANGDQMFLHRDGKIWLSSAASEKTHYDFEEPIRAFSITKSMKFFLINAWAYDPSKGEILLGVATEGWPEYLTISGSCRKATQ